MRKAIEYSVIGGIYTLAENDNPFEKEELDILVKNIDEKLFKDEHSIFLLKASKRLLADKGKAPTFAEVEAYLQLSASQKWLDYCYKCEIEVLTYAPAPLCLIRRYLKQLENY